MPAEPRGPCDGEDDGNEPEESCEERARWPQTAVEGTGRAVGAGHVREAAQVTGLSGESLMTQIESRADCGRKSGGLIFQDRREGSMGAR